MIDRRDALLGALGLSHIALDGCVKHDVPPAAPGLAPAELEQKLADMDRVLLTLGSAKPSPETFGVVGAPRAKVEAAHEVITRAMRTMHVMGTLGELPPESQAHESVQRRVWRALPEVHETTMMIVDHLDQMSPEERKKIDERIKQDPDLTMRVVETMDENAQRLGISGTQRAKMRAAAAHLAWRLKNQGTGALVEDLVGKVDRVIARQGSDAELQRKVAARVAQAQLFGAPQDQPREAQEAPAPAPRADKLYARFRTNRSKAEVQREVCRLLAKIPYEGGTRPVNFRVESDGASVACAYEPNGIEGAARIDQDGDAWEVNLALEVPKDATDQGVDDLRVALRDIGAELRRRVGIQPSQTGSELLSEEPRAPRRRASSRVLTVSLILWGCTLAVGGAGGILVAVGASGTAARSPWAS